MITTVLQDTVRSAIADELVDALEEHGKFHSMPEAYAVIAEEMEETTEALENVAKAMHTMWEANRMNDKKTFHDMAKVAARYAQEVAEEAIQTAAVCHKVGEGYKECKCDAGRNEEKA